MSLVTNVILMTGILRADDELIESINTWLATQRGDGGGWGSLVRVDERAGGTKAMEVNVYLGAFNYLRVSDFEDYVTGLPWSWAEEFLLVTQTEDGPVHVLTLPLRL